MSKEEPVYICPIPGCRRFVLGDEGNLWTCAEHGEWMILITQEPINVKITKSEHNPPPKNIEPLRIEE